MGIKPEDYILRDEAIQWVEEYKFDAAEAIIAEDFKGDDAYQVMAQIIPLHLFTWDETMYAIDEVEKAHDVIISHVADLAAEGEANRDGDDYLITHDEIKLLRDRINAEGDNSSRI